jgi:hypothetical protein
MAFPIILVDSNTGSDTAASGAGPSTALSGTSNASTDATGLIVTLPNGTVLTGVATDGSHVIYLADSTAGARNFGKITASAGSGGATPTVTVSNAFGLNLTAKSWAIGGRRASLVNASTQKLFDNNAGAGDAMPGWTVELQSAHVEPSDISAQYVFRRAGDTTSGPITLRGVANAATKPIVQFSNNGNAFYLNNPYLVISNFEVRNSNVTKTASNAVFCPGSQCSISLMTINSSSKKFWKGIVIQSDHIALDRNNVANTASHGIDVSSNGDLCFTGNNINNCGGDGLRWDGNVSLLARRNLIWSNTGIGINSITNVTHAFDCGQNTIYGNGSDAIKTVVLPASVGLVGFRILNNQLVGNTGYGINFAGASMSLIALQANNALIAFNNNYNNTAGQSNLAGWVDTNGPNADPGFLSTSTGDFRTSSAQQALGYDTANIVGQSYRSYEDIGAWTHATGGMFRTGGMNGGMNG